MIVSFDPTTQLFKIHNNKLTHEEFERFISVSGNMFPYHGNVAICSKCGPVIPRSAVQLVDPKQAHDYLMGLDWPKFCLSHYEEHLAAGQNVEYVRVGKSPR